MYEFVDVNQELVKRSDIVSIDFSRISSNAISVTLLDSRTIEVTGFPALELLWTIKPSCLEGNNSIKWNKHAWVVHNLIAHPVMQLLAFVRLYKQAIWIHDITVPKPIGYKNVIHG